MIMLDAYQQQYSAFPFLVGQAVRILWKTDASTKALIATSITR